MYFNQGILFKSMQLLVLFTPSMKITFENSNVLHFGMSQNKIESIVVYGQMLCPAPLPLCPPQVKSDPGA